LIESLYFLGSFLLLLLHPGHGLRAQPTTQGRHHEDEPKNRTEPLVPAIRVYHFLLVGEQTAARQVP
jgi:hypothetical protein